VDLIGVSILSGSPVIILSRLISVRDQKGLTDVPVIAGGIIPKEEVEELKKLGVAATFTPGTYTEDIVKIIYQLIGRQERMRNG